ncbi:MAG: alpha-amylase family glycosyl hydrolase [Flavobacteriia bacterium]|jgi:glycosidase
MRNIFSAFALFVALNISAQVKINTPEWSKNSTIYEVNVRQFTPEGTFKAFQAHLPRLQKMGVDILWLMPINPIGEKNRKGSLGSYYAVKDYKAVNPEFGSMEDFKTLVKEAQKLGMHVIIDWVANHTSPDNVWVDQCHQNWYTLDSAGHLQPTIGTDWWDVADLNYNNPEMRVEMIESMKFWLKEANIDGFRCDVADWVPVDFWNSARAELDKIKPVFMLAEAENPQHHIAAFDMSYGWEFHHVMNKIAKGEKNVSTIHEYFKNQAKFPKEAYRMQFTSNHDENSWNGTEMERMGDARFAFAVLAATVNGMPLVYNGQEASLSKRLRFFDKDTISWKKLDLEGFYTKLLNLNKNNQALWNGTYGGELKIISDEKDPNVFAFVREKNGQKVLCVFNLSKTKQTFAYNSDYTTGTYTDLFSGKKVSLKMKGTMKLDPWGYKVYYF